MPAVLFGWHGIAKHKTQGYYKEDNYQRGGANLGNSEGHVSVSFSLNRLPCGSAGKEPACNVGYLCSIPGLGGSPGKGKGYPLQYSGLENSMDCIVHGVTKSQTRLSNFHFHFTFTIGEKTWGQKVEIIVTYIYYWLTMDQLSCNTTVI